MAAAIDSRLQKIHVTEEVWRAGKWLKAGRVGYAAGAK
jgi:hypothetical protein